MPQAIGQGVGSVVQGSGGKQQAADSRLASDRAENARIQSSAFMRPEAFASLGNWLFPESMTQPGAGVGGAAPTFATSTNVPTDLGRIMKKFDKIMPYIDPAAMLVKQLGGGQQNSLYDPGGIFNGYLSQQAMATGPTGGNQTSQAGAAIAGRAQGGPVDPTQPYVVGEQGPEVFRPSVPGQILPNPQTQAAPNRQWRPAPPPLPPAQMQAPQAQARPAPASTTPKYATPGNAVMGSIMSYFNNPGQLTPVTYERAQEQANIGERSATNAATAGLTGRGIDPNSPMGAALASAASLGAGRQRNEAARDYSLAQEGLRRQDIQAGMQDYFNVLQSIFGLAQSQAGVAGGTGFPGVNAVNPAAGIKTS